tara:strand:+ start:212 stop:469 length:258 start_codon:yes stop_codon:yes gene_type:complete
VLQELEGLLEQPELAELPILVLANKNDLRGAQSAADVSSALGVHGLQTYGSDGKAYRIEVFSVSVARNAESVEEALGWLERSLKG